MEVAAFHLSLGICSPMKAAKNASALCNLAAWYFLEALAVMQGEAVHKWSDEIIADHEFTAQLVRWCYVGGLPNWDFLELT